MRGKRVDSPSSLALSIDARSRSIAGCRYVSRARSSTRAYPNGSNREQRPALSTVRRLGKSASRGLCRRPGEVALYFACARDFPARGAPRPRHRGSVRDVEVRFYIDPATGLPHVHSHGVTEDEVVEVLRKPGEDRAGCEGSRVAIGQTHAGRFLRVIYVPDPAPESVFVITAYELRGKALAAFRRRRKRKLR